MSLKKKINMKYSILFLILFFSSSVTFSQSVLRITLSGTASYSVVLDGNQQQALNNQVSFTNLNSGKLPIKIMELLDNGMTKIVYNGMVTVQLNTEIIAIYQPQGVFTIFSTVSLNPIVNAETSTAAPHPMAAGSSNNLCMSETSFQKLFQSVNSEVFDDKRTKMIVSSVTNTAISTDHAIQLLKLFTFDDKRLSCALELVPYICDKDNYWKAGDTFTFSSNKKALLNKLEE